MLSLGFFNLLAQIFQASAKPMVREQQTLRGGDPVDLAGLDERQPFAGQVTLQTTERFYGE
jgi:hypothetical protein